MKTVISIGQAQNQKESHIQPFDLSQKYYQNKGE